MATPTFNSKVYDMTLIAPLISCTVPSGTKVVVTDGGAFSSTVLVVDAAYATILYGRYCASRWRFQMTFEKWLERLAKPFDGRAIVKRVMATIFLISQFATAKAAEMDTMGVGVSTCAAFATKMRKDPVVVENWYFAWAQGYMSGLNAGSKAAPKELKNPRDLGGKSTKEEMSLIRQFCDQHPLLDYVEAAHALFLSLPELSK